MTARRPLVSIGGVVQELPVGETLATRKALVMISGVIQELPSGDTLTGSSGSNQLGSITDTPDVAMPTMNDGSVSDSLAAAVHTIGATPTVSLI